ncbi:MAG: DUF3047 domain-containing protein [Pseudomonadota bacterium]|nr:DUF3047 domain-containing protein [Syntrophaceae bacterium]MDI9555407.1 DUF3047 domain-containing protein [Pseudomonadota bacterium]NLX30765.1 DUF3047 domain-containing protein [Deltaproteobacteria bacterium]HNU84267.1 DUF3047 domain-containing protein [Syntrophales bacterium]HOF73362.1 DUF3047 domain-containing protein [Syntrophales bacterium]
MTTLRRFSLPALAAVLLLSCCGTMAAAAGERIPITVFSPTAPENGVPPGWNLELRHGRPEIRIEGPEPAGPNPLRKPGSFGPGEAQATVRTAQRCLHLTSDGESSFGISRNMKVNPKEYPYLSWKWAASRLPDGGDIRRRATDDQAAQIYVVFTPTGFPHALTAPLLGYIWDTECPKGTTGRSAHPLAGRVRYIVLRNKTDRLGQWIEEKRNIYEDYRRLFKDINGGEPPEVVGVTFFINSHNTGSRAESRFCEAYFSKN